MMKIHSQFVGKVIGPRGSTIKELQQTYNVRISISKENDEDGMRRADLEGDECNVQNAMQAISERFLQNTGYNDYQQRPQQRHYQSYEQQRGGRAVYGRQNFNHESSHRGSSSGYERNDYSSSSSSRNSGSNWNPNGNYGAYPTQHQQPQQHRMSHDQENWDRPSYVASVPANVPRGDDWSAVEMKANFEPSLNAYTTSSSSSTHWARNENSDRNNNNRYQSYGDNQRQFDNRCNDNKPRQSYSGGGRSSQDYSYRTNNTALIANNNNNDYQVEQGSNEMPTAIDWDKANAACEEARKLRWSKCPLLIKDFYKEHPMTANMTQEEVERFRLENNNISVARVFDESCSIDSMPKPTTQFEYAFEDFPDLLEQVKKQGFPKPSPIQSQMWPILLRGEDCIGISQTGSGKTLAFLLPALIHTDGQPHARGVAARGGPNVLVLAPTRELAVQIEKEVAKYQYRGIRAVCLYGGNDRKKQIEIVESGCEIIIATPGRLNDLIAAQYIKIESITYLCIDEADRMLDMGFEPQIRKILLDIREDRQTVMTSATWPSGVRRLASSYMKNPYQVVIGSLDLAATHSVTQRIEIVDEDDKYARIVRFVLEEMQPNDKAIIFCGKKDRADHLSCEFVLKGICCQAIHGNREQSDREQALADIKDGTVRILIATDVASRGIDIEDITYVVNYDFPRNIEEYVHRVGRTGRAGRTGVSLSFMTRSDWSSAKELIEILEEANQEIPQELREMAERFEARKARGPMRGGRGGGFGGRGGGSGFGGSGRGGRGSFQSHGWH